MNTNKLYVANPFSDKDMRLLTEFEQEQGLAPNTTGQLASIRQTTTPEEYERQLRHANDITLTFYTMSANKVTDICSIQGTKDIKACTVLYTPLSSKTKSRPIITMSADYALNALGMEEVFVSIRATDKSIINSLETREFENLGEENGYITYLKEKEDQTVNSNLVQLH